MKHTSDAYKGWNSRGYLQHVDAPGAWQFVTIRLADAISPMALERLRGDAHEFRTRLHEELDNGRGACWLSEPECAAVVEENWKRFDGIHYVLGEYVIMPNHAHVVLRQLVPMRRIMHSMKSYTGRRCTELVAPSEPAFWQPDYFDRVIRDDAHMEAVERYVWMNPVKAGLCDEPAQWAHSSLHHAPERMNDDVRAWFKAKAERFHDVVQ